MYTYLIIGKNFANLRDKILRRGDDYILLADRAVAKNQNKTSPRRLLADFSSKVALQTSLNQLTKRVDGVICIYENYVLPTAWVAVALKLPGMPESAAEACTDKYLMRSLFQKASEKISPDFAEVSSLGAVLDFAEAHSYPIILKPANLAKSLLVTKNHDKAELTANYEKMIEQIKDVYKKYAPHRQPKILIEEFMKGSIHSVDAFVDADGTPHVLQQIVDYQTGYDIGYSDNFHYSRLLPSKLSDKDQEALRHVAILGVRALGMKNSAAHIEIIMTTEGPRIVEIGARNGGYRERMHGLANGIDILGAALDLAVGNEPKIIATRNNPCAVLELFPKNPGNFLALHNESALRELPSLVSVSIKPEIGTYVGKAADGHKMCAVIILSSADTKQFERDREFVDTQVFIETSPSK